MTDNKIIKVLNDCLTANKMELFFITSENKIDGLKIVDVLDLINRQKAEIEELQAEIDKQYEQAKADILGNMSDGGTSCHWCIEQHKAEAVKEFTERVIERAKAHYFDNCCYAIVSIEEIDNLVKEMVGEG